jgi:hypothetical protein
MLHVITHLSTKPPTSSKAPDVRDFFGGGEAKQTGIPTQIVPQTTAHNITCSYMCGYML